MENSHNTHNHDFNPIKKNAEKSTLIVLIITFFTMIIEIVVGWFTNSMALFADWWHMWTHALALWISLLAYIFARKYSTDKKFALWTWKVEILGAYTSAILLWIMWFFVMWFSIDRIIHPLNISYDTAIIVAVIGLIINIICALILWHDDNHIHWHNHHEHEHSEDHNHEDHKHIWNEKDLNLQSAYIHVIADALTSVFAILALFWAKYFGLNWLDPFMWLLGSILIFRWTYFLLKDTSNILIDRTTDFGLIKEITQEIEWDTKSKIKDLHIWKVWQNKFACMLCIDANNCYTVHEYQHRLEVVHELVHTTIEIINTKVN